MQEFFTRIVQNRQDYLKDFDPRRRFRNWLLGAVRNFLANQSRSRRARKRGGGITVVSIDEIHAEARYEHEPIDLLTPDRLYERRWAMTVLDRVMRGLEQAYAARNKRHQFERLKGFLVGEEPPYRVIADELGEAEGTVRQQVKRMRECYRDLLYAEIRRTVECSADVESERRYLCAALA